MNDRLTRGTAVTAVMVAAAVAAIVSYAHMQHLAELQGEAWRSVLIPLAVDGMLVASTMAIVNQRRRHRPAGWVPWLGLTLGILASLAANVAAARPELIAQLIAAWRPVALAVSIETLVVVLGADPTGVGMGRPGQWPARSRSLSGPTASGVNRSDVEHTQTVEAQTSADVDGPGRRGPEIHDGPDRAAVVTHADGHETPGDPVHELIQSGAGRPKLATELNISEPAARKLLEQRKNGAAHVQA